MALSQDVFALAYLVATLFFIFGLKGLASPKTAFYGNVSAMVGMVLAVGVTLLNPEVKQFQWILIGLIPGAVVGTLLAVRIQMTAMPQLVAILHSFVGLAAVLVAFGFYVEHSAAGPLDSVLLVEIAVGSFIGAITFTGSLIAFGKLQALLSSNPLVFKGQHAVNALLGLVMVGFTVNFVLHQDMMSFLVLTGIALALGFLLVLPIGGGDMPVIVSMLNSYSGWAAAATGFTLGNNLLITTGALVGSSGAILSYIMCAAMNRSIISVVLGGFGGEAGGGDSAQAQAANKGVKASSVEDAAFVMENASKVIIVPGYGMAVAQAQHSVKELYEALAEKGIECKFAIHPVAGRMPGHMNVLLAESEIPYEVVQELDEINGEFSTTDVVFVIGANDVVNPDAKTNKSSPLYGMPILDAYKAKAVFVNKRSMKAGYAGVDNALFYMDNTSLVFGDAKNVTEALVQALRGGGH
jgi:NAD(P) transhydrogenase subunit beta